MGWRFGENDRVGMEVHGKEPVCEAGGRPNRGGKAAHLSSYARACRADQVPRNPPYTALPPATRSHPRFRRPWVWLRVSGSGGHRRKGHTSHGRSVATLEPQAPLVQRPLWTDSKLDMWMTCRGHRVDPWPPAPRQSRAGGRSMDEVSNSLSRYTCMLVQPSLSLPGEIGARSVQRPRCWDCQARGDSHRAELTGVGRG
jgi:hypothetical protein